jgi:predicted MPP superfamily phosphohydrolase
VVCLTHHPDCFRIAAARGAWLTLAGHTHGGQWAILGHPLLRSFEFMRGRYRLGPAHLYVSTGLGDWLPCRIGVPTEVTVLTLRNAE